MRTLQEQLTEKGLALLINKQKQKIILALGRIEKSNWEREI